MQITRTASDAIVFTIFLNLVIRAVIIIGARSFTLSLALLPGLCPGFRPLGSSAQASV